MSKPRNWSAAEDTFVVSLCLSCPVTELSKQSTSLKGRSPKDIVARFGEILHDEALIKRIEAECSGDVLAHRPVPWTPLESYSVVRLTHHQGKFHAATFLNQFSKYFHPARTVSSLSSHHDKLKEKELATIESQGVKFREFQDSIHDSIDEGKLEPFPGCDDPIEAVTSIVRDGKNTMKVYREKIKRLSYDHFVSMCRDKWNKKSLAALVGRGGVRLIEKTKVMLGRTSPKCTPDIDLTDLELQSISRKHCIISFRTDLNFYLECVWAMVIINGVLFKKGSVAKLNNKDAIDIGGASFIFIENSNLIDRLRKA